MTLKEYSRLRNKRADLHFPPTYVLTHRDAQIVEQCTEERLVARRVAAILAKFEPESIGNAWQYDEPN